ncbi:MAG: exonuclease SbcCD subunit D C-terminal domain-containing protein [bacterium]
MKLLHTSDWHLGQIFYNYDRKHEHLHFLNWLKEEIKKINIDLLLISGDIFDTSNASAESQQMYYTFLRDVTYENPNIQIVITAGNHDSAARLEAPNPLLENMNITVRGVVHKLQDKTINLDNLIVKTKCGAAILAVPYLRQGDYPQSNSYAEGVETLYQKLIEKAKEIDAYPIIAMGHLVANGAKFSENDKSERATIGGLDSISPKIFDKDIDYTALGHLHKAQRVAQNESIRYAGAPLPMSFAEKNYKQSVTLVTFEDNKKEIEKIDYDTLVKLISIPKNEPKPLAEVLNEINQLPDGEINNKSPFLEIRVLITEPEPTMRFVIEEALKGKSVKLARIEGKVERKGSETDKVLTYEELEKINPIDMATDVFKRKYGGDEMPDNMKTLLNQIILDIER